MSTASTAGSGSLRADSCSGSPARTVRRPVVAFDLICAHSSQTQRPSTRSVLANGNGGRGFAMQQIPVESRVTTQLIAEEIANCEMSSATVDACCSRCDVDVDDFGAAQLEQARRTEREHRVGGAGRGPHLVERQQRGIAHGRHRRRDDRTAACRRSRSRSRARASSALACRAGAAEVRAEPRRVDTVRARTSTPAPARRRRRRTPATSRSRRHRNRWRRPRPAAVRVPSGYCVTSIVTPAACIASTNRFIASTRSRLSAEPARNQSMCSSDIVWFAANASVVPSAWCSTTVT